MKTAWSALAARSRAITRLTESSLVIFALLLNLPGELLQAPLYEGMASMPHWQAVKACLRATLGDAPSLTTTASLDARQAMPAVHRYLLNKPHPKGK